MRRLAAPGLSGLLFLVCLPAQGHGFGARYDLPLPLPLWIAGAVSTVVLSFVVMALAVRSGADAASSPARVVRDTSTDAMARAIVFIARLLAVAMLVLIVVAGSIGDQMPTSNIAPTAIWIGWWVGFSYLSAFGGDIWAVVNPWSTIFEGFERLASRDGGSDMPRHAWPQALGAWPACLLFLVFAWLELVWDGRSIPSKLAACVMAFSLLTWAGMFLYGRRTWLQHADPFALAFGILARLSPARLRAGVPEGRDMTPSLVVFVLLMLSTVTFDGVMATPAWQRIQDAAYAALPVPAGTRLAIINTAGLIVFCALVVAVYHGVARWIAHACGHAMSPGEAARAFVLTLVPIAIAYLLAHYLAYFLVQGQLLIRLISDPFGFGWNLFGTARFRPDVGIVGTRFVWYTSLIAIVLGHVVAVMLAHIVALRRLRDRTLAARSQLPMLALMVGYTMMSLWIVAQPIVE